MNKNQAQDISYSRNKEQEGQVTNRRRRRYHTIENPIATSQRTVNIVAHRKENAEKTGKLIIIKKEDQSSQKLNNKGEVCSPKLQRGQSYLNQNLDLRYSYEGQKRKSQVRQLPNLSQKIKQLSLKGKFSKIKIDRTLEGHQSRQQQSIIQSHRFQHKNTNDQRESNNSVRFSGVVLPIMNSRNSSIIYHQGTPEPQYIYPTPGYLCSIPCYSPSPIQHSCGDIPQCCQRINQSVIRRTHRKPRSLLKQERRSLSYRAHLEQLESQCQDEEQEEDVAQHIWSNTVKQKTRNKIPQYLRKQLKKKFRIKVLAILFTIKLKKTSVKIIKRRQLTYQKLGNVSSFRKQIAGFQEHVAEICQQFFVSFFNRSDIDLTVRTSPFSSNAQKQKTVLLKKLFKFLFSCLSQIFDKQNSSENLQQTKKEIKIKQKQSALKMHFRTERDYQLSPLQFIHAVCKHGAFLTLNSGPYVLPLLTEPQLDHASISEKNGYLQMDKNLQKTRIIHILVLKTLIFNCILHPERSRLYDERKQELANGDSFLKDNLYFFGSILYEICVKLENILLSQNRNRNYVIGNWRKAKIQQKFQIAYSKGLSYEGKKKQEKEFISGMIGPKKLGQIFGKGFWDDEMKQLRGTIDHIHQSLAQYHRKLTHELY